jgi:hypothetical protein
MTFAPSQYTAAKDMSNPHGDLRHQLSTRVFKLFAVLT